MTENVHTALYVNVKKLLICSHCYVVHWKIVRCLFSVGRLHRSIHCIYYNSGLCQCQLCSMYYVVLCSFKVSMAATLQGNKSRISSSQQKCKTFATRKRRKIRHRRPEIASSNPAKRIYMIGSNPARVQGFYECIHCSAGWHNLRCIALVCTWEK
jgi:hypothetical protein